MMPRRLLVILLIFSAILSACSSSTRPVSPTAIPASPTADPVSPTAAPTAAPVTASQTLTIFAASSLTEAFTELGKQFEAKNPGAKLVFNFAGSQQLVQQLAQGAPADVFASANQAQMDAAIQAGRISANQSNALVENSLVVIFAQPNSGNIRQLRDLANSGLKLVLADKNVPVGKYALEFLDKASKNPDFGAGFKDAVLKNVVSYEENVRAVLTKISLGEADAGFVYTSDISQEESSQLGTLEIPAELNVKALYFIAPVQDSQHAPFARAFVDFVLAPESQDLLTRYGFQPVQ
jgi:molybdate transport system substrate-binding protein